MTVTFKALTLHSDHRGLLFEPVGPIDLPPQRNVHVSLSLPGTVRGNHLHEFRDEILAVVGPAKVRWLEGGSPRDVDVPSGEAYQFRIPPGVPHAVRAEGPGPALIVGFGNTPHDPDRPDAVPHRLLEPIG